MSLSDSIRKLVGDTGMSASSATFPAIDTDRIAKYLRLRELGKERGQAGQPNRSNKTPDSIELSVLDHVHGIRKSGLDYFEDMRAAYAARISRAGQIRHQIETAAQTVKGDFLADAVKHRAEMASALTKVTESAAYLMDFKERNKIIRPFLAEKGGWPALFFIGVLAIIIESAVNGGFFADANPAGLAGGIAVAVVISLANVGVCTCLGLFGRYIGHVSFVFRVFGFLCLFGLVAFGLSFNLLIGHYRDALQATMDISVGGKDAVQAFRASPFAIMDIKSIILIIMGLTISITSAAKAFTAFDPYPGFHNVYKSVEAAREDYSDRLSEVVDDLRDKRDAAIAEFREAQDLSERYISEAGDAIYGQASLRNGLTYFLESTVNKLNVLVQIYRDANVSARDADAAVPTSFNKPHIFEKVELPVIDMSPLETSKEERRKISETTERAIRELSQIFDAYVRYFPSPDQLRVGWAMGDLPNWDETVARAAEMVPPGNSWASKPITAGD